MVLFLFFLVFFNIYISIFIYSLREYVCFILFFDVCFVENSKAIAESILFLCCPIVQRTSSNHLHVLGGRGRGRGGCVLMYADVRNILLSSWVTKANDGRRDAVRLRSRRHTRLVGWLDPKCCEMLPCERSRDWYGAGLNYVSVNI